MSQLENLPSSVSRPLRRASLALALFLIFLGLWAVYAPLSTTVNLNGKLMSSRPTFELQHPYGGLVGEVLVARHDPVHKGQELLHMDMTLEKRQLETLVRTRDLYLSENAVIESILQGTVDVKEPSPETSTSPHFKRHQQALIQSALQDQNTRFLQEQLEALAEKIALTQKQLELMKGRQVRQNSLADRGLIRLADGEVLKEQILLVQSEIETDRAQLASLKGEITTAQNQAELINLSLSEQLSSVRDENKKRVHEVERQIAGLRDRIQQSIVKSPVEGVVSDIYFEATGTYATRGATLISLTQPLSQPRVSFQVPTSQIDQLHPGMTGQLVLTSLPQRSMPRIEVVIQAVSPRATLDEEGNPRSYAGVATIKDASIKKLSDAIDGLNLVEDMPARLLINIRETTMANYLFGPMIAAFDNAVQD